MTIEHCRALLGITGYAAVQEIKDAYRKKVKEHHPDQFISGSDKLNHTGILASVNEAYRILLEYCREPGNNDSPAAETDYDLYKKGLEYYQIYFDSFFELFAKRKVKTGREKIEKLKQAVFYFNTLVKEFPDSEWVTDAKDKLRDIEKALRYLKEGKGDR